MPERRGARRRGTAVYSYSPPPGPGPGALPSRPPMFMNRSQVDIVMEGYQLGALTILGSHTDFRLLFGALTAWGWAGHSRRQS